MKPAQTGPPMVERQTLAEAIEYWCDIEVLHPGDLLSSIDNDNGTHRVIVTPALQALARIEPTREIIDGYVHHQCPLPACDHDGDPDVIVEDEYAIRHAPNCPWVRARQLCGEQP